MLDPIVFTDALAAAAHAACEIADAVRQKPNLVLGLATGETMRPVYAALVRDHKENGTCWNQVTVFNLDDYVGLPVDHPASFRRFMRETLFDAIDIVPCRCLIPDGLAPDLDQETKAYEMRIAAAGGIDLQLLGLGRNGHIAFNEPGSSFSSRTRVVDLACSTRTAARSAFASGDDVPSQGLTMGIGTILQARRILLVATGPAKASVLSEGLSMTPTTEVPVSALQEHGDVTVVADDEAGNLLVPRR